MRLQTRLDEASDDLDDASEDNLAALRREAERLIAERSDDIDRLIAMLTRSGPSTPAAGSRPRVNQVAPASPEPNTSPEVAPKYSSSAAPSPARANA